MGHIHFDVKGKLRQKEECEVQQSMAASLQQAAQLGDQILNL